MRVWNYLNKSLDLTAYFEEDPTSCAMHPSGLHVLVGFTDKLRLMNILMDDIRPCREFSVKGCVDCTFSNGGHLFAATTGNAVNVYGECLRVIGGKGSVGPSWSHIFCFWFTFFLLDIFFG